MFLFVLFKDKRKLNVTLPPFFLFSFLTASRAASPSRLPWRRETKKLFDRVVAVHFQTAYWHCISIALALAPPPPPFSSCTATSVSGPGSWGGRDYRVGGPAGTRESNWGPRTPPSAAAAVPPLADRWDHNPETSRGSEVACWLLGPSAPTPTGAAHERLTDATPPGSSLYSRLVLGFFPYFFWILSSWAAASVFNIRRFFVF